MKRILALSAVLMLVAGGALAQGTLYEHQNEIGVYLTDAPPADVTSDMINYTGPAGQFVVYVVCTNPWNMHFGDPNSTIQSPISQIGGFEFHTALPEGVFVTNTVLPPATINFATAPDYLAGSAAPVVDNHSTLLTLTLASFTQTPGWIYLLPVQNTPQSIPNQMAITDYFDDFRLNPAYPSSGSYEEPVFGLWQTMVVPTEDASWGDVKSLFR
ncbi:MAG: hypothetical protein R6X35_11380 [Candidatus Krumholzibacteriia bacterium]